MKLIEFPEMTTTIAKDQPEYLPLPAHRDSEDPHGIVTCCWRLTWKERIKVLLTGCVWHQIMTLNRPLQPQKLQVSKPDMAAAGTGTL